MQGVGPEEREVHPLKDGSVTAIVAVFSMMTLAWILTFAILEGFDGHLWMIALIVIVLVAILGGMKLRDAQDVIQTVLERFSKPPI